MNVLVVTEIRLYREGVAAALRVLPDVELAASAATSAAAVTSARRIDCDVVLLDMGMEDSTRTARALVAARPHIHVVALGVKEDGPEIVACAEAGVAGYVSREAGFDDLAEALRAAVRGEAPCSGKVAAGLIRHIAHQARLRQHGCTPIQLTRREREVLRLLETEMTNKEIARALDLRLSTVKNHVHNILTKLGASGRAEIPQALARLDLDPVPEPAVG
ncbi:response regulator transcription factor [Micromonospora sp. AP08]|uniref:LuxR C-terminal-related transcriptional regulator n=1 Tax=Micromonospora sp. AP08 TaxID=2604467 RepID=UPI001651CC4F|nr:response regulator transcription factor [Micromonospora sp. AP08]